ncbi:hypothetical protein SAMN05421688_2567 [Poseidonocella pacifica]|uniref:Membrane domain of glycerophosphoryl diester phosphodiesterase n=1 Tax=Poseidonocella pacifica TaxID=871651 RepID=A0A1I0XY86_9RHOB|nr:hypothetical protein [Poseidonocella pacifica]SFB05138.1 hypothetical protein SAMN05421688_2567 [Poseidonocella pacifica]
MSAQRFTAFAIFKHGLRMLLRNLGPAFRISLPLVVVSLVAGLYGQTLDQGPGPHPEANTLTIWSILLIIPYVIATLWTGVAWHRFVLLEETQTGFLPPFDGGRILSYFLKSLQVWIVGVGATIAAVIAITLFTALIASGGGFGIFDLDRFGPGAIALFVIAMFGVFWAMQRFLLVLPAAAVGHPFGLRDSWNVTRPYIFTILGVLVLQCLLSILLSAIVIGFILVAPALGFLQSAILEWFNTMFILSLITTFYGICVEERDLS